MNTISYGNVHSVAGVHNFTMGTRMTIALVFSGGVGE